MDEGSSVGQLMESAALNLGNKTKGKYKRKIEKDEGEV